MQYENENDQTSAIGIYLAVSAGQGDKLLFRYPRATATETDTRDELPPASTATRRRSGNNSGDQPTTRSRNSVYATRAASSANDDLSTSNLSHQFLASISDTDMSRLLARPGKCGKPFLLKIECVQFVGFPLSLKVDRVSGNELSEQDEAASAKSSSDVQQTPAGSCVNRTERHALMSGDRDDSLISFNVVFALAERGARSSAVRSAYLELAKRIAIAIKHCELRTAYLSHCSDDQSQHVGVNPTSTSSSGGGAATNSGFNGKCDPADGHCTRCGVSARDCECPEGGIYTPRSRLARELFAVYRQAYEAGRVRLALNGSVEINWTLVNKAHTLDRTVSLQPTAVLRAIHRMKSFHAVLLLTDSVCDADAKRALIDSLPPDHSSSFDRFIHAVSATRNLVRVANEADLTVGQAFEIAAQLVWFGKAFLIYPLAETNIYAVAPRADCSVNAKLHVDFAAAFPSCRPAGCSSNPSHAGATLLYILSELSIPKPICELQRDSLLRGNGRLFGVRTVAERNAVLCWLLRNQLIVQLHLYIDLVPFAPTQGAPSSPTAHSIAFSHVTASNANVSTTASISASARRSLSAYVQPHNLVLSNIPRKPRSAYPRSSSFSVSFAVKPSENEPRFVSGSTSSVAPTSTCTFNIGFQPVSHGRTRNAESASFVQSLAAHSEVDSQLTALVNTRSNDSLADVEPERTSSRCSSDTQAQSQSEISPPKRVGGDAEVDRSSAESAEACWLREAVNSRLSIDRQAYLTPEDLRFLAYLLERGYFLRSKNHIEEITYVENVLRHDLLVLVDKFYPLLTTCLLPDPCTSVFVNYHSI